MVLGSGIRDPGSEIRDPEKPIPDPGSRGQKAPNPGSRIRIRNTDFFINFCLQNLFGRVPVPGTVPSG